MPRRKKGITRSESLEIERKIEIGRMEREGGLRDEYKRFKQLLNNEIDIQQLNPGDHIYVHYSGHSGKHHGIYMGGEEVIHFITARKPNIRDPCAKCDHQKTVYHGVVKTCLDCFLSERKHILNHKPYLYQYNVQNGWYTSDYAGKCSTFASKPLDEVINTVTGFHRDSGSVDCSLFNNDNESFAFYCKTGEKPKSAGEGNKKTAGQRTKKIVKNIGEVAAEALAAVGITALVAQATE